MSPDVERLIHYQTGLFIALVGLLLGKDVVTRAEVTRALEVVGETESDALARELFGLLAQSYRSPAGQAAEARFHVILGGRDASPDTSEERS